MAKLFMSKNNQQQMFEAITRWQQSGLAQKTWCEQNNMAYSSFHYWYRRFRKQHPAEDLKTAVGFVQLVSPTYSVWCEVSLPSGTKLCFHQPLPASFLKSLVD